jgi:hypothetical protein
MSLACMPSKTRSKAKPLSYLEVYEERFGSLRDQPIALLELGVAKGKSIEMSRDCFPKATIVGVALLPEWESTEERVRIYRGGQDDLLCSTGSPRYARRRASTSSSMTQPISHKSPRPASGTSSCMT